MGRKRKDDSEFWEHIGLEVMRYVNRERMRATREAKKLGEESKNAGRKG